MTSVNGTYTDRLKLAYHLRTDIANNPEVKVLRKRLQNAPIETGPNVYTLPYNVLLSAKGFLLEVPKGEQPCYRPLRANHMPREIPPAKQAQDAILRSIHDYVMDPAREMKPAGKPYNVRQRAQLAGVASGVWRAVGKPFRALNKWARQKSKAAQEPEPMRPWFEG